MPRSTWETWLAETPMRRASSRTVIPASARATRTRMPTKSHWVSCSGTGSPRPASVRAAGVGQSAHGVEDVDDGARGLGLLAVGHLSRAAADDVPDALRLGVGVVDVEVGAHRV